MAHEALAKWLDQVDSVLSENGTWLTGFKENIDKYVLKYVQNIPREKK